MYGNNSIFQAFKISMGRNPTLSKITAEKSTENSARGSLLEVRSHTQGMHCTNILKRMPDFFLDIFSFVLYKIRRTFILLFYLSIKSWRENGSMVKKLVLQPMGFEFSLTARHL